MLGEKDNEFEAGLDCVTKSLQKKLTGNLTYFMLYS